MKKLLINLFFLLFAGPLGAQTGDFVHRDSALFRECFKDVRPFTDVEAFHAVCYFMDMPTIRGEIIAGLGRTPMDGDFGRAGMIWSDVVVDSDPWELLSFRSVTASSGFVVGCMKDAYKLVLERKPFWPEERVRLVEGLRRFDSLAVAKPLFYETIHGRYDGDYEAYVKDLYGTSLVTSRRRIRRFCRHPSVEALQADLGFQFAVGFWLYELSLGRAELQEELRGESGEGASAPEKIQ